MAVHLVAKFSVNAEARLVRWNGIVLLPSSARKLVEIRARINAAIHCAHVERRSVGERAERRLFGRCRRDRLGCARRPVRGAAIVRVRHWRGGPRAWWTVLSGGARHQCRKENQETTHL